MRLRRAVFLKNPLEGFGGAKGARTPDLLTASQALFQTEL